MSIKKVMRYKTIILDLDGPLLDGKERHYQCYTDILRENNFQPLPIEKYWEMKRQRLDRRVVLRESNAEHFYDVFFQGWLERIETQKYLALDKVQDSAQTILSAWQNANVNMILATMRHHPENLFWQLEQTDLLRFFTKVIPVGNLGGNHSKAAAVEKFLPKGKEHECLWIGDTEVDVASAQALNIPVAALYCGLRTKDYLQSLNPNYLVLDLLDLKETI